MNPQEVKQWIVRHVPMTAHRTSFQGQQDPALRPEQPSSLSRWHHAWWNRGTSENLSIAYGPCLFWSFEPPKIPEQDHTGSLFHERFSVIQWQMFCLQWYARCIKSLLILGWNSSLFWFVTTDSRPTSGSWWQRSWGFGDPPGPIRKSTGSSNWVRCVWK